MAKLFGIKVEALGFGVDVEGSTPDSVVEGVKAVGSGIARSAKSFGIGVRRTTYNLSSRMADATDSKEVIEIEEKTTHGYGTSG